MVLKKAALERLDDLSAQSEIRFQKWGLVICGDRDFGTITGVSRNLGDVLRLDPCSVLGKPPTAFLSETTVHQICNALCHREIARVSELVCTDMIGDQRYDVVVHRSDRRAVVELLPVSIGDGGSGFCDSALTHLHLMTRIEPIGPPGLFIRDALVRFRVLTGFDRVAAIRCTPTKIKVESDFGLFMPEFKPAQNPDVLDGLADCNGTRPLFLPDLGAAETTFLSQDSDDEPLDISASILRAPTGETRRAMGRLGLSSAIALPVPITGDDDIVLIGGHENRRMVSSVRALQTIEIYGRMLAFSSGHYRTQPHLSQPLGK